MAGVGTALWNELSTSDLDKARAFYAALLGWSYDEMPMSQGPYVVAKAGDAQAGGMMGVPGPGMPSMWVPYFEVADVDETAARAEAEGGKVMFPAMDVPEVGRMVWVSDPTGAVVAFMKPAWDTSQGSMP